MDRLPHSALATLRAEPLATFRRGGGSRADVLKVRYRDSEVVIKDHNACDPWFARLVGSLLVWRERRALQRLVTVAGVPTLLAQVGRRALVIQHFAATRIIDADDLVDWGQFFTRLEELLQDIHQCGVAHCDLRSPNNTLITAQQTPVLVDFVACVLRGAAWNVPARWVFRQFCRADDEAVIKLKHHVAPELLSEAERQRLNQRGPLERVARWIGVSARRLSRRLFTRRTG